MDEHTWTDEALSELAAAVATEMHAHGRRLATAESCTGGWIAKVCTELPGSSTWFERGYVTYSDAAKHDMLGIDRAVVARHGAVSEEVAAEMATGARKRAGTDFALAVSGIAGPDGGTPDKPVGTVCFAWAVSDRDTLSETCHFRGGRDAVRRASVAHALKGLLIHMRNRGRG